MSVLSFFFFQAEDGIRDFHVTGVQTCALPISGRLLLRGGRGPAVPHRALVGERWTSSPFQSSRRAAARWSFRGPSDPTRRSTWPATTNDGRAGAATGAGRWRPPART